MKQITIILLLFIFISCGDIFHDDDNPYLNVDNYQEQVDLLNGIYYHLASIYNEDYFISMRRGDDINIYNNYRISGEYCSNNQPGNDEEVLSNIYQNAYIAIININKLLTFLNETDDKVIMGEVYFIRAYLYFTLARFYGTPPLIDDYYVDYLVEKPSYREVYEFIERDLLLSLDLLPDTYTLARIPGETPHKGTAKALLAEVYLSMAGYPVGDESKYELAAQYAGELIDSAAFYGWALEDDLHMLWSDNEIHSKENVMGIISRSEYSRFRQIGLGGFSSFSFFYRGYIELYGEYHIGFYFYDHFPDGYRKIRTLTKGKYETNSIYTFDENADDNPLLINDKGYLQYVLFDPLNDPCRFIGGALFTKWFDLTKLKRQSTGNRFRNYDVDQYSTDTYLLRYAQTLLTYAEAKARSGNLDESAYEAVNKIRRRANKLDLNSPSTFDLKNLSPQQFIDSVVWERAWELCFEPNGRWFDIIRLDLRDEIESLKYPNDAADVVDEELLSDDWYFFLIPQEDRWVNPNF